MIEANLESIIREIGNDNGTEIEQFNCTQHPAGGWNIVMKASGNPFSSDNFGDEEGQELLVPLRGRDCKYHSARLGSARFEEWQEEKGIPTGWRAEWCSSVEAWDEYTDTPDIHHINAWMGPEAASSEPRRAIRKEFEQDLVGELSGDLFLVVNRLHHLSIPLDEHQKEALKGYVSTIMRSITCL